ncbi:hypothetical protein J6590_053367 [Homalodisca vitripennis]|nr:hypothetical protein J6590_053367 [Homalodisca vitripennis]
MAFIVVLCPLWCAQAKLTEKCQISVIKCGLPSVVEIYAECKYFSTSVAAERPHRAAAAGTTARRGISRY